MEEEQTRVMLAKHRLEAHDRGVKYVAAILKDFGCEVIYLLYGFPDEVVQSAIAEDVDIVGLSFLSGGHMYYVPEIIRLLKERHMEHVLVIVGGVIPSADKRELQNLGVAGIFGPGFDINELRNLFESGVWRVGKGR